MAVTVEVVGGACDGVHFTLGQLVIVNNTFTCGGSLYTLTPVSSTLYRATVEAAAAPGPATSPVPQSADLNKAWSRLMHTLAFYIPGQLQRQQAALTRIRKAVR